MNTSERQTIRLASSRSYAKLAKSIKDINEGMYAEDIFKDDRIDFNPIMSKEGDLEHFEITASALDFFQIGLRYGRMEEKDSMQPYLKDFYREALETSAL